MYAYFKDKNSEHFLADSKRTRRSRDVVRCGRFKQGLIEAAKLGRIATHSLEAETLRAKTQRRHAASLAGWQPSELPDWLNEEAYRTKIQPALAGTTVPAIATALGISQPYATDIRAGKRRPHPRHWEKLARIVGVSPTE
jgi:hypothetical protein